jgi:xylan 1,4-beta-xylosidase
MKKTILFTFFFALLFCSAFAESRQTTTTICNPMNLDYGWGTFNIQKKARGTADPVIVLFKNRYYLFSTHDLGGYRVSDNLINWKDIQFKPSPYFTEPDVDQYVAPAVASDEKYMYFIRFNRNRKQDQTEVLRTADPESGKWEQCGSVRRIADPALYIEKGRFYVYYGLGADQPTKCFELDPITFTEISGSLKQLREEITDVKESVSGYQFGRRELYDKTDASSWKGKFSRIPCPEGSWMIKHDKKYYLMYATPGTISNWYCDVVMEGNSPTGPFKEQVYNPASLKVGGFIGSAGHSSVFQDKFGNWWHVTSMWVGLNNEFERRLGLFPVSFDKKGRMRIHTVLGDYPTEIPQKKFKPADISIKRWMLQSYHKKCSSSSNLDGSEPGKAADENIRTLWSASTGNSGEWFKMDLGKRTRINAVQINFADQDADLNTSLSDDYHAYKLYYSTDNKNWQLLIDKSSNKTAVPHDYIELPDPVNAQYLKIENVHSPRSEKFALLDLRVFGFGYSNPPLLTKNVMAIRDKDDERYATVSWEQVHSADGYLIRFGYKPDFLNQCIQLKGNETTSLLLHILTKGVKYFYRVDTYNDSELTKGKTIIEQ